MNKIDQNINQKLKDYEVEPPLNLWHSIEAKLEEKRRARALLLRRRFAAAAAILLLVSTTFYLPQLFINQKISIVVPDSTVAPLPLVAIKEIKLNTVVVPEIVVESGLLAENRDNTPSLNSSRNLTEVPLKSYIERPDYLTPGKAIVSNNESPSLVLKVLPFNTEIHEKTLYAVADLGSAVVPDYASSFNLSVFFAPQQTYRYQNDELVIPMQSLESERANFSTGIKLGYRINNRWELQGGITYNRQGQNVNDIASFSHPSLIPLYSNEGFKVAEHPQSMSTSMGGIIFTDQSLYFADVSSSRIITMKGSYDQTVVNLLNKSATGLVQRFEYLELPVSLKYKIFNKGINISAKGGLSVNYLMASPVYLQGKSNIEPIGKSVGVSSFNVSALGGLAFSYPLTPRMNISLEPTASIFLRPIGQIRHLTRETYPYSWSLHMGIAYNL